MHQLLLDPDFEEIQNLQTGVVDFMSILRVEKKELQHSNMLSWLFNPNENHGLGDYFIKAFIKKCFIANHHSPIGYNGKELSIMQFDGLVFDDLVVKREHRNIDLLFSSEKSNFAMVIENKIFSGEALGQLTKYRTYADEKFKDKEHLTLVYLSFYNQVISEDEQQNYLQITYEDIKEILKDIIKNERIRLKENIKFIIQQYLQSIQSLMGENDKLHELSKKIYAKYRPALDEIYKHNYTSGYNKTPHNLNELIKERKEIISFKTNKSYVRFQPKFLIENEETLRKNHFLADSESIDDSWLILYEFNIGKDFINFDFKIGVSELPEARQKLFDKYMENKDIFTKVDLNKGKLFNKWHMCFQEKILTRDESERFVDDIDKMHQHIKKKFDHLLDHHIPKLNAVIKEATQIIA